MPVVQIQMLAGRSLDQKRALVKKVTEAVCESVGSPPASVRVILHEMPHEHYAVGGILKSDDKNVS